MITREEAKDLFRLDTDAYGKPKAIMTKLNKIYDSFEQRINSLEAQLANTEQLTCDGCIEKRKWKFDHFPMQCEYCSMKPRKCYFTTKDTQ